MLYKKTWSKGYGLNYKHYTGWFLFGFIPIYIVRERV